MSQWLQRLSCARADSDVPCNALWNVGPVYCTRRLGPDKINCRQPSPGFSTEYWLNFSAAERSFISNNIDIFVQLNTLVFFWVPTCQVSRGTDSSRRGRIDWLDIFLSKCFLLFSSKSMAIVWVKVRKTFLLTAYSRLLCVWIMLFHTTVSSFVRSDSVSDTRVVVIGNSRQRIKISLNCWPLCRCLMKKTRFLRITIMQSRNKTIYCIKLKKQWHTVKAFINVIFGS